MRRLRRASQTTSCWTCGLRSWLSQRAGLDFSSIQTLVGGGNGLEMLDEFLGLGGEAPGLNLLPVIIELAEDAIFGVGIQTEPCYRGVIHNKPFVMFNVVNSLADAWRIRICSFIESLYCSIPQVVRFSTYQEPTAVGAVRSAIAVHVASRRWLSFFR